MKLNKKTIIISSIIVASIVLLIAVAAIIKINVNKPKNLLKELQNSVDLQIKGFVYTEVGENNAKYEVKAETATYDKKQNLAVLDKIQITLTTSEGKIYVIKADQGQMLTDKKNIEIKGHVVIHSEEGYVFTTDYLKYNDAEKKFYTDAPVAMEGKKMKITGKGLTLFMNKNELKIPSRVRATIN
ncbi:MAG: LPS export ABC transporter periplasmic protein LptC [Deltaproteobacteria bacterium]|nr:LPS export ABC transporter periplasmic protein LptC [Deltaproteobacteria bacterium]